MDNFWYDYGILKNAKTFSPGGSTLKKYFILKCTYFKFKGYIFSVLALKKMEKDFRLKKNAEALTAIVPFRFCVFLFPGYVFFRNTPPFHQIFIFFRHIFRSNHNYNRNYDL